MAERRIYTCTRCDYTNADWTMDSDNRCEACGGETEYFVPAPALLPAERIALTVASAQVRRGDDVPPNTTAMLVLALERIRDGGLEADCD